MANKKLFKSNRYNAPAADGKNSHGNIAYNMPPKHLLINLALTGCLNRTFYSSAEQQLETILSVCQELDIGFIAKTAIYAHKYGFMRDVPALLLAIVAARQAKEPTIENIRIFQKVFSEVCTNVAMIRNFVQIVRSGITGRKSLGTLPKRIIANWFTYNSEEYIFRNCTGNEPSVADLIMLSHPKANTETKNELFKYLLNRKDYAPDKLPAAVQEYEEFKRSKGLADFPHKAPYLMLTSIPLDKKAWINIARNASWSQIRQNLNTYNRNGVFKDKETVKILADKLRDAEAIKRSKVFPYQILCTYMNTANGNFGALPVEIREALQDALDISISNVPEIPGTIYVFPDISGSMRSPITGTDENKKPSVVHCLDAAALIASSVMYKNRNTTIIPFSNRLDLLNLNPRDSVITNTKLIKSLPSGGTNCSLPLLYLNENNIKADAIIYCSDYESWLDRRGPNADQSFYLNKYGPYHGQALLQQRIKFSTIMAEEWKKFSARNKNAKLICIDMQPNTTIQALDDDNVLNIGGFSDSVFTVINSFIRGEHKHLVDIVEQIDLNAPITSSNAQPQEQSSDPAVSELP